MTEPRAIDSQPKTVAESAASGRAARSATPRRSHADWQPAPDRPDPIVLLEEQAVSRDQRLVPIRYGRMLTSPFAFFRGAALVMAADLDGSPATGITSQICGDAHVSNFGVFGTPERQMSFDVNDFDETNRGPWEWDVKRLAASIAVGGRQFGFSRRERRNAILATVDQYRRAMRRFAAMRHVELWTLRLDIDRLVDQYRSQLGRRTYSRTRGNIESARARDSLHAFAKLARVVDGEPRIVSRPPLVVPIEELADGVDRDELYAWLGEALHGYGNTLNPERRILFDQYRLVHVARKVVGVGSVGLGAWIVLFIGRDAHDPLFLQVKEAGASVLERFTGRSKYGNHGQRVVAGQRMIQTASDPFLGWVRVRYGKGPARDYYVRQLYDWKGGVELEDLNAPSVANYGRMCGWTLARAHARAGNRIAIAAYLGSKPVFDEAIAEFAETYADQNERDYQALKSAAAEGRVQALTGL